MNLTKYSDVMNTEVEQTQSRLHHQPCKMLALAVLEAAIHDFKFEPDWRTVGSERYRERVRDKLSAIEWVYARGVRSSDIMSFPWVCWALGLDPTLVRNKHFSKELPE